MKGPLVTVWEEKLQISPRFLCISQHKDEQRRWFRPQNSFSSSKPEFIRNSGFKSMAKNSHTINQCPVVRIHKCSNQINTLLDFVINHGRKHGKYNIHMRCIHSIPKHAWNQQIEAHINRTVAYDLSKRWFSLHSLLWCFCFYFFVELKTPATHGTTTKTTTATKIQVNDVLCSPSSLSLSLCLLIVRQSVFRWSLFAFTF